MTTTQGNSTSRRWSVRDRIIDVLETFYGEWWTVPDIAERLGIDDPRTVYRAIARGGFDPEPEVRINPVTGDREYRLTSRSYLD